MWLRRRRRLAAALLLLLPLFVARWAYAQYAEEQRAYDRTVRTLMAAVETKDLYTRGHSERVSAASVLVARAIGMREDRVGSLRYAGMLHDVGKLGVPTRVLQKSGGLTEDEFAAIQRHPMQGLEIVREIEFLDEANAGIMHHHERIDGLGYPMGLAGDRIPEFARVIAVADAFDSMTTTRSYRGARTLEAAVAELRRCAGTQFDPAHGRGTGARIGRARLGAGGGPRVHAPPEPDEVFDQDQRTYRPRRPDQLAARGAVMTSIRRRLDDAGTMGYIVVVASARFWRSSPSWSRPRPGGFVDTRLAVAFGAFIAFGELMRITLPGGRDAAPIGDRRRTRLRPAHASPRGRRGPLRRSRWWPSSSWRCWSGSPRTPSPAVLQPSTAWPAGCSASGSPRRSSEGPVSTSTSTASAGPLWRWSSCVSSLTTLVVDAVLAAAVRAGADGAPFSAVLRNEVRAQIGIGSAIGATGALIALAATIMSLWALPLFVVPLLLTQFAFRRYAAIRQSTRCRPSAPSPR